MVSGSNFLQGCAFYVVYFDRRVKRWRARNHVRGKDITGVSQLVPSTEFREEEMRSANEGGSF